MTGTLTEAGAAMLFANPPAPGFFVLWYKPSHGRGSWEPVANGATERECLDAIETSGKRHGRWNILPNGREP